MAQEVILISVHGMGDTPDDFDAEFEAAISGRLGASDWSRVY